MSKDIFLQKAEAVLERISGIPQSDSQRVEQAVVLAGLLLQSALKNQTREEKLQQAELAGLMGDVNGKSFTMSMTDQCFRSQKTKRVASQMVYLLERYGVPKYLSFLKRMQLSLFKRFGKSLHFIAVPLAVRALKKSTEKVILPGEPGLLAQHIKKRAEEGVRLNLNHLGEAVLGEGEARRRIQAYLDALARDDVEYVSIKASTMFSQISLVDWEGTLTILKERLREFYQKAMQYKFLNKKGEPINKFVNLDMEEYADLLVTKEVFKQVLSEPEFKNLEAGIVLQAYLPDSFRIQEELTEWAMERVRSGGAPIKIRIVKGANLAMEKVEASLRHWSQAPYTRKGDSDANFKKMLFYACEPDHAAAVHVGVASHNLFDVAYALLVRKERGLEDCVCFEMLEGMADHIRRAVQALAGDMLLYCPVASEKDFQSAIAYLIRRLDENTGPENFLRHSFDLVVGSPEWKEQVVKFTDACEEAQSIYVGARREQNRQHVLEHLPFGEGFKGEPDTDVTLPHNLVWAQSIAKEWQEKEIPTIPLVIDGKEFYQGNGQVSAEDPSIPGRVSYQYVQADGKLATDALNCAKNAQEGWKRKTPQERGQLLSKVAVKLRENRAALIGAAMRDIAKPFLEADAEVSEAIDFVEYYLRSMLEWDKLDDLDLQPKGTALVLSPWNFPVAIAMGGIAAALVTGNTVIFKPASQAVLTGWTLVQLLWEAGVPQEVLQFINCQDEPTGSQLVQSDLVDIVILTGATSTARLFLKMRADLGLYAETGGKNALIIMDMCDRDAAIKDLVQSAFGFSGQKCSAASLAILEKPLYKDSEFLRQLKEAVESLHVGSVWDPASKVVPIIDPPSEVLHKAQTSLESGEGWLVQPKQIENNPRLWSPGVKLGVSKGSFTHQTEFFGPFLGVMCADDLDQAIEFANGTEYGLTSGIHTLDTREIDYWLERVEAGNCYVNRGITGAIVRRQPFGGFKASAFGSGYKAGGPNYLLQFMNIRQAGLPQEKLPASESVNSLTRCLDKLRLSVEDLGAWYTSISNYAYWANEFAKDSDEEKVLGQDNILRYVPRKSVLFRVLKGTPPLDILCVLAAALSVQTPLHLSYTPHEGMGILSEVEALGLDKVSFYPETEADCFARIAQEKYERIRTVMKPSLRYFEVAAQVGSSIAYDPVMINGQVELLHYLREVAISANYHRYGNLGEREEEERSAIL